MMKKIKILFLFFTVFSFYHRPLLAQGQQLDRSVEQILKDFFEGNSMKQMEEQVRKMMEEMESSFSKGNLNLFDDETLNQLLRESGLFVELDHGQHEWLDSETERILVLKLETQENTPVDIKIENGQIRVQAKIEKEVVTETASGQSRSVTIQQYSRVFLVPEDCEADSVKIENKEGEILIKFKKLASKAPKLQPLKKSEDDLTI